MTARILGVLVLAVLAFAQSASSIRGKLIQQENQPPVIDTGSSRTAVDADDDTLKVLADQRLAPYEIEIMGRPGSNGRFTADPTHTHPVHVRKDGKRLHVTYWCDVCYIRTFVPGNCWCCQKNTDLDLREKLTD